MLTIKPKTRKEIYMAYLSGDMSLELPEPLTRDEVNLYNLCKNKAYGEYTTEKEVLAECQPEFVADEAMFVLNPVPDIEAGAEYIVNWNGVEYKCTAVQTADDSTAKVIALGNMSSAGGENTGEPFTIGANYGEQTGCFVIPLDGSTTLTISIRQEVTEVKKISGKYVEGMGYTEKSESVVLAETNFDRHLELDEAIGLVSGETYVVEWNGQEYEVTASDTGSSVELHVDNKLTIADMNEAIASEMGYYAVLHCDSISPNTVSVKASTETVHPIDQKLIVLTSTNGTKYNLSVADDGTLSAVAAT